VNSEGKSNKEEKKKTSLPNVKKYNNKTNPQTRCVAGHSYLETLGAITTLKDEALAFRHLNKLPPKLLYFVLWHR